MPDKKFTLKDYEQLIHDVLYSYFQEENVTHDLEELGQVQLEQEEIGSAINQIQNTNL